MIPGKLWFLAIKLTGTSSSILCNTWKNRYWAGNIWHGGNPWKGHGREKKSARTKEPRYLHQNTLMHCLAVVYSRDSFCFIFRDSKEKAEPGWLWWVRRGWRAWSLLPAAGHRPAPGRLHRPHDPAWHASWLRCSRYTTGELLRWETETWILCLMLTYCIILKLIRVCYLFRYCLCRVKIGILVSIGI